MTNPELHQESGAMSEGAHAVGFIDSQMGRFTTARTLYEGRATIANYRASGLITFPEDRALPVEPEPEDTEHQDYQEWRKVMNL
jgi:hypothetical protein